MEPQGGDQLPEHGLFLERSQRSRVRRTHLGGKAGDLKAPAN